MNFWIFAIAMLLVAAALVSWPLFSGVAKDRIMGLFIVLIVPLAGILLYQNLGTPEALKLAARQTASAGQAGADQPPHANGQGQMDQLIASLQQRMNENPDDADGWLILGRSLKSMQRFAEAQTALANANRLLPDDPLIMIELAETTLFASGKAAISPQSRQLIESALAIDPQMQKGLWLMGMVFAQEGNEEQAIASWQKLLEQLDPASGAAQSVTGQIQMAQARMGMPATQPLATETEVAPPVATQAPAAKTTVGESGIPATISLASEMSTTLPDHAVLFVFIHPEGVRGMPLAVKRLPAKGFPMSLNFTDADLLNPGMSLKDFEKVDISARISLTGGVTPTSGDVQANVVTVETNSVSPIALHLDQRVP